MKPGFRFLHPRVINLDGSPMEYRVTKIAKGFVYFKPVGGGNSAFVTADEFDLWRTDLKAWRESKRAERSP